MLLGDLVAGMNLAGGEELASSRHPLVLGQQVGRADADAGAAHGAFVGGR